MTSAALREKLIFEKPYRTDKSSAFGSLSMCRGGTSRTRVLSHSPFLDQAFHAHRSRRDTSGVAGRTSSFANSLSSQEVPQLSHALRRSRLPKLAEGKGQLGKVSLDRAYP